MTNRNGTRKKGVSLDVIRVVTLLTTVMFGLSCLPAGMAEAASPFTPSFSPEVGLVPYEQQVREQVGPAMERDGNGNLYALWVDFRNGHPDIYFAYRPANGQWGPNVKVNDDAGKAGQYGPAIAVDDLGNAYAVWRDRRNNLGGDIYFAYRPAGGNWGTNIPINDNTGETYRDDPAIATDGTGKAYVIWTEYENGSYHLFCSTVSRPTTVWTATAKTRVDDTNSISPRNPSLCYYSPGGLVIAAWEDERNGNKDIYGAALITGPGGTWGTYVKINDDAGNAVQRNPKVASKGYYLLYAWEDYRNGDADIYSYSPLLVPPRPPNKRVNSDTGSAAQTNPSIFVKENEAYAVWVDRRNGKDEIYYSYKTFAGAWDSTLCPPVNCPLSNPKNPQIVAGAQLYVLFEDSSNGNLDIFFTWSLTDWICGPERVNDDPPGTVVQREPALAVDRNGNATALWSGFANGLEGVYSDTRPSGGGWGNYTPVSNLAPFRRPSLALDQNNNGYALLEWERIFFSNKPAGNNWGALVEVSTGTNWVSSPDIAVDPTGNAYAIWTEDYPFPGGWDILSAYRPAGGAWGANAKVTDDSIGYKASPSIVVDKSGNALAVWEDRRNGTAIFASHRPAGGTWGTNVQVSDGTDPAFSPAIALDGAGNAYALWQCQAPGGLKADICFAYRPFQGAWGSPEKVTSGSAWNVYPDIAVDDQGNAFAVWVSDQIIVFFYRPVGGSWSGPFQVSTDTTSGKANPAIALDGKKNIYILWEDYRYGIGIYSPAVYFSYALGPVTEIYLPLINK